MKLAILAIGTRGDIQPYIALANGFLAAGHGVIFISEQSAAPLLAPHRIHNHLLPGDLRQRLNIGDLFRYRRNPYFFARIFSQALADLAASWAIEGLAAVAGSDMLLVSEPSAGLGFALAEKLQILPCAANINPYAPTAHLPSALLPWPGLLPPGRITKLSHEGALRAAWLGGRSVINQMRSALGLKPWSWPFGSAFPRIYPQIYGFSPHVVPPPPDWPSNIMVTGYWYDRRDSEWHPPAALKAFLAKGPLPIHVGFGSMKDANPGQLTQIVMQAIRKAGLRAILTRGWGGVSTQDDSEDVFNLEGAPYEWLFRQTAAVVHHGGSGTTGAVVRSGVPSIVVPYLPDQPYWGWSLRRLGVAPKVLPRARLTADALAKALVQVTTDQAMRLRAQELGRLVRAEDGVARAVEVVEGWLMFANRAAAGRRRRKSS